MKKNLKIYLILIPSVVIIVAVIVSQIISIKKAFSDDAPKPEENQLSIKFELNPEVQKIKDREDNLNTKVDNYREGERKLKETESAEISFSSVFKAKEKEKESAPIAETEPVPIAETQSQKADKPSQPSVPAQPRASTGTSQTKKEPQAAKSESSPEPVSSMGVYTARNTQGVSGGGEGQASKKTAVQDYIHAVLEEDKTIEHGSSVIFILSKPAVIDGVRHNPGSTLYGKAALASEMFDIQVYQIKSTDGNMYRCSLTAYDENYNPGIRPVSCP